MNGDKLNYPKNPEIVRFHLIISTVSRETLLMQNLVGGDYFRTPVIIQVPDILVFC